jgi:hypothetical protein
MAKTIVRKATEATLKREVKDMRKVLADRLFELRTDADLRHDLLKLLVLIARPSTELKTVTSLLRLTPSCA